MTSNLTSESRPDTNMSEDTSTNSKPLFRNLTAEEADPEVTEIESFCVNCELQGITRLFLTRIPFFKEVVVSSFGCDNCGYRNSELVPAGKTQEKGIKVSVLVNSAQDLNRQVVQTGSAEIKIPEIDFEIPPSKGALTTIEGVLEKAVEGLSQDQPVRKALHPDLAVQIDEFIVKLQALREGKQPFHLVLTDPSGNSFIENPHAPQKDSHMEVTYFKRTSEQNAALGLNEAEEPAGLNKFDTHSEVFAFQGNCPSCNAPCPTNMKLVNIPHFKEVVIMATVCDACGYRDNEVKGASGIGDEAKKITLKITDTSDMTRDLLKSDTCSIELPELEFETGMGSIGGKFTTVEGLLINIKDMLKESNPFTSGDSSVSCMRERLNQFCGQIDSVISGDRLGVHLILDDPAGNSYLQNFYAPEDDPEMTIEHYKRSEKQDDELGLLDMKT